MTELTEVGRLKDMRENGLDGSSAYRWHSRATLPRTFLSGDATQPRPLQDSKNGLPRDMVPPASRQFIPSEVAKPPFDRTMRWANGCRPLGQSDLNLPQLAIGTPRKLPKANSLEGRVVVLDVAFAGAQAGGFDKVTLPFIRNLGDRLRAWVDHHDHDQHERFKNDPRFVLATKAEHGACPEMIDVALVERIGPIDTVCCHNDFDGLASAAKWIRGGVEPYPGCDADARAIDTRLGEPSAQARTIDRALRGRPRDFALYEFVVRALVSGLSDRILWEHIESAAKELEPIEAETQLVSQKYVPLSDTVVGIDVTGHERALDKTLLLLLGQEKSTISLVVDRDTVSIAARFDSGINFLQLFGASGGMPTRISMPRSRMTQILEALGCPKTAAALLDPV